LYAVQTGDPEQLIELLVGRKVWVVSVNTRLSEKPLQDDFIVTGVRRFLAAGPVATGDCDGHYASTFGFRPRHLIQLWSDKGLRTVATADIRLSKPKGSE